MIPPMLLVLAIGNRNGSAIRLWIPLFLLWPLLLLLFLVIVPFTIIIEILLGWRGIRPFSILIVLVEMLTNLRGLTVDVSSKVNVRDLIKIKFV